MRSPEAWREIRELREELSRTHPDGIQLCDVSQRNPHVVRVLPSPAAESLTDGTMRLATADEIAGHEAMQALRNRSTEAINRHWSREHGEGAYVVQFGRRQRS